jgi:predicted  nucleic acid-binding Zn-ribbon protein
MTAKIIRIKNATRFPSDVDYDQLELDEGVNVIVGEMNTGKTKWLQMIDFALGDVGGPEEAFAKELADKYERITLTLEIGDEDLVVERRWKEVGAKTKIFVNGEGMASKQFSEFILGKLNIPLISVPSGNPYGDRTWPELSWRELFRHMYKQENLWSDLVQKQAEVVRSACILQFLDVAKNLYSEAYGRFVSKQKERAKLDAQKDVFVSVMQDLATDLVRQPEMTVSVTPDSINISRKRLNDRLAEIEKQRAELLNMMDKDSSAKSNGYTAAKEHLESLYEELGHLEGERNQNTRRRKELVGYSKTLDAELAKFARAKTGVAVFADLKVTHCPACDQAVPAPRADSNQCHVCGQQHDSSVTDETAGNRRIEFEEQQVSEELDELKKLIAELDQEKQALDAQITDIGQALQGEQRAIRDAQTLAVRAIPPELSLLDQEVGQISAEQAQLDRVARSLGTREQMSARITALDEEIATLDAEIKLITPSINYSDLGDLIADRMNDYLNSLNADRLSKWKTGRVSVKLRRDDLDIMLDDQRWTAKAGGTAQYIVQLAYHYALFSLTKDNRYNYPGFLVIDFPPHFAKAANLKDSETYLLEPFVKLCALPEMKGTQVIIAGRAFDNLPGANYIRL